VHRCRYLGGVLDFTGELNRYAVQQATARNTPEVQRCRDLVELLMGQFLQVSGGPVLVGQVLQASGGPLAALPAVSVRCTCRCIQEHGPCGQHSRVHT
jgi:hypothetical protein